MNILCGICSPSAGSAAIYGTPVGELADGPEMKRLVGVCPQFNILFDVLTVEEHLRIFAAIKGIPLADVDAEVTAMSLLDLDGVGTLNPKCFLFPWKGVQSAEGSGLGEDHDGPGQESEWRPKEEALSGHRHPGGPQGTSLYPLSFSLALVLNFLALRAQAHV